MDSNALIQVKDLIPLIGAVIGFTGVIVGALAAALANYLLKGKEYKQAVYKELALMRMGQLESGIKALVKLQDGQLGELALLRNPEAYHEAIDELTDLGNSHWVTSFTGYHLIEIGITIDDRCRRYAREPQRDSNPEIMRIYNRNLRIPLEQCEHDLWGEMLNAGNINALLKRHKALSPIDLWNKSPKDFMKAMNRYTPPSRVRPLEKDDIHKHLTPAPDQPVAKGLSQTQVERSAQKATRKATRKNGRKKGK